MKLSRTFLSAAFVLAIGPLTVASPASAFDCPGREVKAIVLDLEQWSGMPLLSSPFHTISETCISGSHDLYTLKGLDISTPLINSVAPKIVFDYMRGLWTMGLSADDVAKLYAFVAQKEKEGNPPKSTQK